MTDKPKQLNTQTLLYDLAESLSSLVIREHQILQDELNQVGALVEDAVQQMGGGFRDLNSCVAQQVSLIEKNSTAGNQEELNDLAAQVNSCTSTMNRVLQFDDIVQQLAGHASDRIAQMQQLFTVLDRDVARLKVVDTDNSESQAQLKIMLECIGKYRQLLEKENPVKQGSMIAGGIELF